MYYFRLNESASFRQNGFCISRLGEDYEQDCFYDKCDPSFRYHAADAGQTAE